MHWQVQCSAASHAACTAPERLAKERPCSSPAVYAMVQLLAPAHLAPVPAAPCRSCYPAATTMAAPYRRLCAPPATSRLGRGRWTATSACTRWTCLTRHSAPSRPATTCSTWHASSAGCTSSRTAPHAAAPCPRCEGAVAALAQGHGGGSGSQRQRLLAAFWQHSCTCSSRLHDEASPHENTACFMKTPRRNASYS